MSKIINLTKGLETIVDDNLYGSLSQHLWYAQLSGNGYRPARRLKDSSRRLIYIYHQILNVNPWELLNKVVDHKNRDPLDNRVENLRIVTQQENMMNRSVKAKGVSFCNTYKKWKAYIDLPYYDRINIGTFNTEAEALAAREALLCV